MKETMLGLSRGVRFIGRVVLPALVLMMTMLWLKGAFRHDRIANRPDTMPKAQQAPADAEVLTVNATAREVAVEMVGEVKPEFEVEVAAMVTARIVRLDVRSGERVRKGQVLAVLDDRDLQARVNQAQQALVHAQATRDYARIDCERKRILAETGTISKEEFDVADTRLKEADAEVDRLQHALDEAKVALSYSQIESPVDGMIIDRAANVGDLATPGKTLLVMFDSSHLWFQASVSEQYAPLLTLGQDYLVQIDALKQEFTIPLTEIVPQSDPSGRTVLARFRLPVDSRLYPGLFGRMHLVVGKTEDILVPRRALRRTGQLDMVTVEAPWGLEQRVVVPGQELASGQVQILSGLKNGERIVLPAATEEPRP